MIQRLAVIKGYVEGYYCDKCNGYNDILTVHCRYCNSHRDKDENLYGFEIDCIRRRGLITDYVGYLNMNEEKMVELHSKFFNQESQRIENMSYPELVTREEEFEEIVIGGRASIQAIREKKRKLTAQMTQAERDKLITRPDLTTGDALLIPKLRKDRQTKADKLADDMAKMGMSPEDINAMMGNIMPGKTVVSEIKPKQDDSSFTFNQEKTPSEARSNGLVKPATGTTQEMLLEEVLSRIDLSTSDAVRLEEKINTAMVLVPKTQSKVSPDKLILAMSRLEELKAPKAPELPKVEDSPLPKIASPKPFDISAFTATLKKKA